MSKKKEKKMILLRNKWAKILTGMLSLEFLYWAVIVVVYAEFLFGLTLNLLGTELKGFQVLSDKKNCSGY